MAQHTQEPWFVFEGGEELRDYTPISGQGWSSLAQVVTTVDGAENQEGAANARRIVACVNACAGIPTEALEGGAVAEVSTSLRELLDWCRDNTSPRDTNSPHQLLLTAVRALHNLTP